MASDIFVGVHPAHAMDLIPPSRPVPKLLPDLSLALPDVELVAEEIAAQGWSVKKDFLSPALTRDLVREGRELWEAGAFRRAGIGAGADLRVREDVRSDFIHWLDEEAVDSPALGSYFAAVEALRLAINRQLYLGLFRFEAHLAVYPPGALYARHLDRFQHAPQRVISVIVYLNEGWNLGDGGELRLELEGDEVLDVRPEAGTLACFLSAERYHQVLAAKRERWSLTGWLRTRD